LDRQEADMIRWLNILLMPTDKLVDEEQMSDLEDAAIAWEKASKTSYQNKPLQFATQKDLFAAQIYRQSSQQWSALRKATSNLITSTKVATVLSKLTVSIEKDLIAIRDDRQIHLDLSKFFKSNYNFLEEIILDNFEVVFYFRLEEKNHRLIKLL